MAKCALCSKGSLFLKVSSIGLCPSCQHRFDFTVPRLNQILQESQKIISTTKSIDTKVSRCKTALSSLNEMRDFGEGRYDVVYAVTKSESAEDMISTYQDMLCSLESILEGFEEIIFGVLKKYGSASKQKFVEIFNANVENCGRNPAELPYSVDKSIADILKRLEYENKIVKEKIGTKYVYSIA